MTNPWQIWLMKPHWLCAGRFYRETPNPHQLSLTHSHVRDFDASIPNPAGLRDHKEFIWETQQRSRANPFEDRNMAWGDVMVAPSGEVWVVEGLGFKSIGAVPRVGREQPHHLMKAAPNAWILQQAAAERQSSKGPQFVTHTHKPDPRAPRPPGWPPRRTPEQERQLERNARRVENEGKDFDLLGPFVSDGRLYRATERLRGPPNAVLQQIEDRIAKGLRR